MLMSRDGLEKADVTAWGAMRSGISESWGTSLNYVGGGLRVMMVRSRKRVAVSVVVRARRLSMAAMAMRWSVVGIKLSFEAEWRCVEANHSRRPLLAEPGHG